MGFTTEVAAEETLGTFHSVGESLRMISRRVRLKLGILILCQVGLAFLDLIGVLLFGFVGLLAAQGATESQLPSWGQTLADFFGISLPADASVIVWLAIAAVSFLLLKSILFLVLVRATYRALVREQVRVSRALTASYFSRSLLGVERYSSQKVAYGLTTGTVLALTVLLGLVSIICSEVALMVVLLLGLFFIDPGVTVAAIVYFALLALVLQKSVSGRSARAGQTVAYSSHTSFKRIQETIMTFREGWVGLRIQGQVDSITEVVEAGARASVTATLIGQLPKVVFESALALGVLGLVAWQATTSNAADAVGVLALFLMAGTRLMPAMQRLNASIIQIRTTVNQTGIVYELAREMPILSVVETRSDATALREWMSEVSARTSPPEIRVDRVSFTYPGSDLAAISDVSFQVTSGTTVALVGGSGAGKSTLVDLLLGIFEPMEGEAEIAGIHPSDYVTRFPGAIGYVPQSVAIVEGSVRDNVALGVPRELVDDDAIWDAITAARISEFLVNSRAGLDTSVGERGVKLSGGQRQRLGLARALYSRPRLLVLDEATSALDTETEQEIAGAIADLGQAVTKLVVAHRLSTVRECDALIYLEAGRLIAMGSFEEVRRAVPSFARQAQLSGL